MDEAKIIISVILVSNNKTTEVVKPGKETFNADRLTSKDLYE